MYDLVNACETLDELANVIENHLADENGEIEGRMRKFDAKAMAEACRTLPEHKQANALTRMFGIRQQAFYILYYDRKLIFK